MAKDGNISLTDCKEINKLKLYMASLSCQGLLWVTFPSGSSDNGWPHLTRRMKSSACTRIPLRDVSIAEYMCMYNKLFICKKHACVSCDMTSMHWCLLKNMIKSIEIKKTTSSLQV